MAKIKYEVINPKTGRQIPWTGTFENEEKADIWYNRYGKKWEEEGRQLVRVVVKSNVKK